MTWISLVCLIVLTSSAFGRSGYGSDYGGGAIQQVPKLLTLMRDQNIQRRFLPTISVPSQGYGQQSQQPITTDWSSPILQQQDTSIQQVPKFLTIMRDQNIQRPFLPTVSVVSQGYGQQSQQPINTDWSSSISQQQQQDIAIPQKLQGGYGASLQTPMLIQKTLPNQNYGQVNQGYGAMTSIPQFDQQPVQQVQQVQQVQVLTEADILCRGQQPETIIPIENARKFVVCLADSKGVEQECPKGLFYHQQSGRCERKLGPLENQCVSQPCLNGGQCIATDSSYQCQCAPGFDGKTCELDARICQTQQPCGQSQDTKCQSFRLGAALQYICIFQDGLAYGLNTQQVQQSPCQGVDGPHALAVSNNGFIICDGERMFVESCPGGTVWDDFNKACVWPDMQTTTQLDQQQGYGQSSYGQSSYGQSSYGQQPKMISRLSYGNQWPAPQLEQPKLVQSYGGQMNIPQQFEQPKLVQSYGGQMNIPQQFEQPKFVQSYGGQMNIPQQFEQPKLVQSYGSQLNIQKQFEQPKLVQSYGGQWSAPQFEQPKLVQSYGGQWPAPQLEQPKLAQSYGSQINIPQQLEQPKLIQSYGSQINIPQQLELPKHTHSHISQMIIPQQLEQPKFVQSYGGQQQQQQQQQQQDNLVSVKQSSGY